MKKIDTSTLELDQNTLKYAADDLWKELSGIELCYPQVLNDSDYNRIKAGVVQGSYAALKQDALETLYLELIGCLGRISTEPTNIVSLAARRDMPKNLADYLPKTFKAFVDKVTEAKLQAEYYENAYEGAAEALFMDEIEGGINAVVPRHREEVKGRIYEILTGNADEEDEKAINKTAMDRILELMGIRDAFDLLGETVGQADQAICELILFIREEIDTEYEDVDAAELRLKNPSREEFRALGSGMQKLLLAMAQDKPRYGDTKELGRAHRMEFARRITVPPHNSTATQGGGR